MLLSSKPETLMQAGLIEPTAKFRAVAAAFHGHAEGLLRGSAFRFEIDDAALARAFAAWRFGFDDLRDEVATGPRDLLVFSAGLMLADLFAHRPIDIQHRGVQVLKAFPEAMTGWPTGYFYTSYCFSVAAATIKQTGLTPLEPASIAEEPEFWSSFRENVEEDAKTAIGFFDLLCGVSPNWELPLQRRCPVPG